MVARNTWDLQVNEMEHSSETTSSQLESNAHIASPHQSILINLAEKQLPASDVRSILSQQVPETMNGPTSNTETFHTPTLSPSLVTKKKIGRLSLNLHNLNHVKVALQQLEYYAWTFLLFILFLYAAICPKQGDIQ